MSSALRCIACGKAYPLFEIRYACDACGDLLEVAHDRAALQARDGAGWRALFEERLRTLDGPHRSGVWRYHELILPDLALDEVVTMPEGNTNLYRVPRLETASDTASVRVKHEGENPTLSFKDRGMTAGVSFARRVGARVVACASTGDTSAAMAAYAARVPGMRAVVVLPRHQVTLEQLAQPIASGALTVSLPTDFDGCIRILREVCARRPLYLLNSVNPLRIEGQKAIAYEIAQQCGWDLPEWVVVPVGNAGNISAIGRGFDDLVELGVVARRPRLLGAQAEAASPLARAEREGFRERVRVTAGPTSATAIKIGDPVSYDKAVRAVRASGGHFVAVSEQEIHDAKALVDSDGVSICPNSATAVAGFVKARAAGTIARDERIVIVATAHGCKFSTATIGYHGGSLPGIRPARANRVVEIEAEPRALEELLEAGEESER
ncbi:MAG TPA: threonine synthase [Candidatus Polarisedimenticolia bacterium]|nr:threonine synthase [Candidatus Polarisedimenticolia bacterium]